MENSKTINQINQLFHNKGVRQEDRFTLLIDLLESNKNGIQNEQFKEVIQLIESFDYKNTELIQEIFMSIGSKYTKYNLDQFYTPLTVSLFINSLMITGPGYNAIDPAGGTGDLLLYYNGNKTIWDIDENALKLCKFNYELHKQKDYTLVCKNALENFKEYEDTYSYSILNPPFGSNTIITDEAVLNKFELGKGKKKQEIGILFLELGLKLLKNDGILFIIVPAGYVGNGNKVCSEMRDLILKNRLIASISLPENTFKRSGTGVNTYLLIIQKKTIPLTEPYNIFISGVNNIGYNLTKKNTPIKYKYVKETGATIVDSEQNPIVDNELQDIYSQICSFKRDTNLIGLNTNHSEIDYEYIESNKLDANIMDIKRYLQSYLSVVEHLTSLKATRVKNLGKIIKSTTKIDPTNQYKYIDISEINSPLYGYKELYGWELPSRAKYSLKQNDILVSKLEGTMSYCVITEDDVNYIATNGVTVIRPNNLNSLYMLIANIMSKNFVTQHKAFLTGSIMASLSDTDIEEILIDDKIVDIESTKRILETLKTLQQLRR